MVMCEFCVRSSERINAKFPLILSNLSGVRGGRAPRADELVGL